MNKYIKLLTESLFDDIDDIFSDDDEDLEILSSLEDIYLPYVDLGLPSGTLWYKCNLGAKKETDYGLYFLWGDITLYNDTTKKTFNWTDYKYCDGKYNSITKYCDNDNLSELEYSDDAAYVITNGTAEIPTHALLIELYNSCKWELITINNVIGYKVTGKNGNYIFLPATGLLVDNEVIDCDMTLHEFGGYYQTKTLSDWRNNSNCSLVFRDGFVNYEGETLRCFGLAIRPVLRKS